MHDLVRDLSGIDGREEFVCTAVTKPGDLVQTPDGLIAYVMGTRDYAVGETVSITTDAIVDVDSASATTFAVGATAYYDLATKLAVASGATKPGLGAVCVAKTSGQTKVRVRLNRTRIPAA